MSEHPAFFIGLLLAWHLVVWGVQLLAAWIVFWLAYMAFDIKGAKVVSFITLPIFLAFGVVGSVLVHIPAILERSLERLGVSPESMLFILFILASFFLGPILVDVLHAMDGDISTSTSDSVPTNVAEHKELLAYKSAKTKCLSRVFIWTFILSLLVHGIAVEVLYNILGL